MKYVKIFAVTAIGAALAFGFVACREKAPKDTEVTIEFEDKTVQLALGESVVLKVKVTPESEASKVVWESSNPKVATVDNQGKVTSIAAGDVEVKASIGDKSATCRVSVTPKEGVDTEVTIEFEEKTVQLAPGESVVLKVKVTPESEASKVVWESTNPQVATVDNQGKVTSIAAGDAEVKASIGDKSATCRISVTPKEGVDTEVTIEFEEKTVQLAPGESVVLKVKVTPESEASKVVWESTNPQVATVDNQGKVTSIAAGDAEVKASIGDKSATCRISVVAKVNIGEKLDIGNKPFALNVENCIQYVWDYKANKEITYKGDKPAIIDFWASWCGPCKMIAPFLDKLAEEYGGKAYIFKVELGGNGSPLKEEVEIFKAAIDASNNPGLNGSIPAFLLLPADGSAPKAVIGAGPGAEAHLRKFFEEEVAKAK